jgi:hypothetical protein
VPPTSATRVRRNERRLAYHIVPKLLPERGVPDTGLAHGRLNVTLRVSADRPGTHAPGVDEINAGDYFQCATGTGGPGLPSRS